ncbi:MAG: ATP-binding protein [Bacteriovoracaceae bacterium]
MGQADELLRSIKKAEAKAGQGKLKIFMGMVAGVGKTFSMLKAAHSFKQNGGDPLVGYIETHGRVETEGLIQGLTILPRKKLPYKDVVLEEFDIDACLEIKPKLVLIDELAHTNAPGSRHQKRWQDVLEILNNGIDVWTTLNVQHVESRSETVSSVTGIRVTELVPDTVIDRADEIVLIDLIPDEIVMRLREGKIYAPEKVDSATQNFFRVSNLTALREVALRLMAERVDHELKDLSLVSGITNIKTHHKIMVAIFGSPYSESLIRYTRKMAYGLNCKWYAGYVNSKINSDKENELLNKNIELVKQLGGEVYTTQNESVVDGLLMLAEQYGASQIVVGNTPRKNIFKNLISGQALPHLLISRTRGIDVNIISPVEKISIRNLKVSKKKRDFEFDWRGVLSTTGYLANVTFLNAIILPVVHYRAVGIIYLMGITIGSLFIKNYNIYLASFLGGLCWNIFFIPPKFTLHIEAQEDWMLLLLFIVAGVVIGVFTRRLQEKEKILMNEGNRATQLYNITKELSRAEDIEELVKTVQALIEQLFGCPCSIFLRDWKEREYDPLPHQAKGNFKIPVKEEYALQWVVKNRLPAGRFTDTLPSFIGHYIPIISSEEVIGILALDVTNASLLSYDQKMILDAIVRQLATGLQREHLEFELRGKLVSEESERIYKTLLNSVSHEMRTPLATIKGFSAVIESADLSKDSDKVKTAVSEISEGVERLDYVVQNLLDMSRLESGNLKLNLDYADISDLIRGAVSKVKKTHGERTIRINMDRDLPLVFLDYFLMEQTIENILRNAFLYTPEGSPVDIDVHCDDFNLLIKITDYGPGIRTHYFDDIFKKFYRENPKQTGGLGLGLSICKAIVELHRGSISVHNEKGKGASFVIQLPRELDRELLK